MYSLSKSGLVAAQLYGDKLPSFKNQRKAEKYFMKFINEHLQILDKLSEESKEFIMDYSVESLKKIELWYFKLYQTIQFSEIGIDRYDFERCIAVYFGEVAVRNIKGAKWIVTEYAFTSGKFEFGVNLGLMTRMLFSSFSDLYKRPNNKRKQCVYREFNKDFKRNQPV